VKNDADGRPIWLDNTGKKSPCLSIDEKLCANRSSPRSRSVNRFFWKTKFG